MFQDTAHKAKEKEKGKSPNPHPYEDPEGRVDLPASIKCNVDHWKRPVEFILAKTPVVVDPKSLKEGIDLLSVNDHLANSEVKAIHLHKELFSVTPTFKTKRPIVAKAFEEKFQELYEEVDKRLQLRRVTSFEIQQVV